VESAQAKSHQQNRLFQQKKDHPCKIKNVELRIKNAECSNFLIKYILNNTQRY